MAPANLFEFLGGEFSAAGIRWLLVGGFAVNFHGVSRGTADVDVLIAGTDHGAARDILQRAGYEEFQCTDAFARYRSPSVYLLAVDLMFVDGATFARMWPEGIAATIGKVPVRVAALKHLLAMKLHALKHGPTGRQRKDLDDIRELASISGLDLRADEFHELCRRFADDTVYGLIIGD